MATITTYQLTPYLPIAELNFELNSELFHGMVNKWVRNKKENLEKMEVDISLFFNHDLKTGKTIIGYPLVIYHYIDGQFFLTGINQGAHAVNVLSSIFKKPFSEKGMLFPGFKKIKVTESTFDIQPGKLFKYQIIKWIPFHHKDYMDFKKSSFSEKVSQLNERLHKHLEADLGKYLELNFKNMKVEVTDILSFYSKPIVYEGKKYYAYDIEIAANVELPRFITLGNIKSLGFGRVEPL